MLDAIGAVLMILLIIATRHTSKHAAYDQRVYHQMLHYTLALNALDLIASMLRPTNDLLTRIVLLLIATVLHSLQLIVAYRWVLYVDYRTHQSRARLRGNYGWLLAAPCAVMCVMLGVNIFTGMFFRIDEMGSYQATPALAFPFAIAFGYAVYSAFIPLMQRRSWRYYLTFPVAVYLVPVLLGNAVHLAMMDVSVSWVAMAVGFVSLQLNLENDISYMDPLTGLYNRHFLNQHLQNMFERMNEPENFTQMMGILIDMDDFKFINDHYGHLAGDQALQAVGMILRESLPLNAVACRFGGDEFVVIDQVENRDEAAKIIENIRTRLEQHNQRAKEENQLSMSIGWTLYAKQADTVDTFLSRMDEKMYREKELHHAQSVRHKKKKS